MQNSQRAEFNPALELAIAEANRLALPVLVGFGLTADYPEANVRHYTFMLEGLAETEQALRGRGLGFVIRLGSPDKTALTLAESAALVVCDRGYLRAAAVARAFRGESRATAYTGRGRCRRSGRARLHAKPKSVRVRCVRNCCVARRFLRPLCCEHPREGAERLNIRSEVDLSHIPALLRRLRVDHRVAPVGHFREGHTEAKRRLADFVARPLQKYATARTHPGEAYVSTLSPYLHFGQISPVEVALAAHGAGAGENTAAFLRS